MAFSWVLLRTRTVRSDGSESAFCPVEKWMPLVMSVWLLARVVGVGIETADVVVHEVLSRRRRRGKLTPGIFGNL